MIILYPDHRGGQPDSNRSPTVVLFGVGLIGSAIRESLRARGYRFETLAFAWIDPIQQELDFEAIRARLESLLTRSASGSLRFIWSAGSAGFASSDSEVAVELESFRKVVAFAESFQLENPVRAIPFMMVGSVGGLFEGQRHVGFDARPAPLRAYGRLKLDQEALLATTDSLLQSRVYRLTSVFGPTGAGRRKGLVSTLIENCIRHETTRIVGNSSTLRDFVWSRDIGNYIAREATRMNWATTDSAKTLGSGKPASIHEIIHDVETSTGLKALIRFELEACNSSDITLASSILPQDWISTDLGTAIRQTCLEMTSQ